MARAPSCVLCLLLVLAISAESLPLAPSFIWSNHRSPLLQQQQQQQHRVDYQIVSPQSVAAAALDQFQLSRDQCSSDSAADSKCVDLLVTFTGGEVLSGDLSRDLPSETVLELKNIISASETSLAFPYASSTAGSSFANELVHALHEKQHLLFSESAALGCPGTEPSFSKPETIDEFISVKPAGNPQLLLVCLPPSSEGATIKNVITKLDEAGVRYIALYSPDPFPAMNRFAIKHRLLASVNDTNGSSSGNSTAPYCDDVCQNKATLLEAIFVAVVLLIILISGLCCMMGIQTPLRFEKPHES